MLKIGEGGFGCVYKGSIKPPDGQIDPLIVAIKKLNRNSMQVYIHTYIQIMNYVLISR